MTQDTPRERAGARARALPGRVVPGLHDVVGVPSGQARDRRAPAPRRIELFLAMQAAIDARGEELGGPARTGPVRLEKIDIG